MRVCNIVWQVTLICAAIWWTVSVVLSGYLHSTCLGSRTHGHIVFVAFRTYFITMVTMETYSLS
jgi:hypothetical protein